MQGAPGGGRVDGAVKAATASSSAASGAKWPLNMCAAVHRTASAAVAANAGVSAASADTIAWCIARCVAVGSVALAGKAAASSGAEPAALRAIASSLQPYGRQVTVYMQLT